MFIAGLLATTTPGVQAERLQRFIDFISCVLIPAIIFGLLDQGPKLPIPFCTLWFYARLANTQLASLCDLE